MEDQRLIDVETKLAHQELAIEELQQVVYEQQVAIEKLEKALKKMNERLEGAFGTQIGPGNEKPPHW
jgi:SlyX protein